MTARIIDGRKIASDIIARLSAETRAFTARTGIVPGLTAVLVGDNPASQVYVRNKARVAGELGFTATTRQLPANVDRAALADTLADLNADPAVHGILVQLPLPAHLDAHAVIRAIRPDKDVDGFHPFNVGLVALDAHADAFVPCTPAGGMILIKRALGAGLVGREALVLGRSNIVGKPMAALLVAESATVTLAHSKSRNLPALARRADILIAAVGRPELVRGDWIKPGAVVIDVGINRVPAPERGPAKTRLVGDVAFAEAVEVAGAITPVPGGVGPMTIALLMANTLTAARRLNGLAADPLV